MTNLQAALGAGATGAAGRVRRAQAAHGRALHGTVARHLRGLQLPVAQHTDYAENIYWVYGVVLEDDVPFDAEEAMRALGRSRGSAPAPSSGRCTSSRYCKNGPV